MVFSSMVFLWLFLPIVIVGYFILNRFTKKETLKNVFLLLASLLFYAWGEPKYIILMIVSILVNWLIGMLMQSHENQRKFYLIASVVFNLGLLGVYKYFNFFIDVINTTLGLSLQFTEIALPIGISFFTFQILSYIIDLYRKEYEAQKNVINLALYISFFPQLIAGPIVKYIDVNRQLTSRTVSLDKVALGIRRFIYGLAKKVLIANTLAYCVDQIYGLNSADVTGYLAWIGMILYTLQIYFDFSGYSDMAIGLGKIFGFDFLENFNYPYLSSSIHEFWNRWHISLGSWFKNYLYFPLGGNRKGTTRTYVNLFIVFFATGLWHGASYNFILWGLYHGFFSILERVGFSKVLKRHTVFSKVYTLLVVSFGWVLFRAETLTQATDMYYRILMPFQFTSTTVLWQEWFGNRTIFVMICAIFGCGVHQLLFSKNHTLQKLQYSTAEIIYCVGLLLLCFALLASSSYNPFIYFRF